MEPCVYKKTEIKPEALQRIYEFSYLNSYLISQRSNHSKNIS